MQDGILVFKTAAESCESYPASCLVSIVAGNDALTLSFTNKLDTGTGANTLTTVDIDCADGDSADLVVTLSKVIQKGTVLVFDEAASDYPVTGITGISL